MTLKKKILVFTVAGFLFFITLFVAFSFFIASLITEEFLVHQLEANLNARAVLKKYSVGIFSGGSLTIEGLALGPRDRYANNAVELAKRPKMKNALLEIPQTELSLDLFDLIDGRFTLNHFLIERPKARLTIYKNGGNSLTPLLNRPAIVNGKPNPDYGLEKQQKKEQKKEEPKEPEEPEESKEAQKASQAESDQPFQAQKLPLAASLKKIGISSGHFSVLIALTGDQIEIRDLNFFVTDIEIDPADLKNKNSAHIGFDTDIVILTQKKKETGKLSLRSKGRIVPFDRQSGKVNARLVYNINLKKDSYVAGFSLLEKIDGHLQKLRSAGITITGLGKKAALIEDVEVKLAYNRGLVTILNDPRFPTKNFDLLLKKKSRFQLASSSHNISGGLHSSSEMGRESITSIEKNIKKSTGLSPQEAQKLREKHFSELIQDNRIVLNFSSSGPLADPNVKFLSKLPDFSALLKDALSARAKQEFEKQKKKLEKKVQSKVAEERQKGEQKVEQKKEKAIKDAEKKTKERLEKLF